jgi:hypothetical protein
MFRAERELIEKLVAKWYEEVRAVTEKMNGIFSEKGQMYDRESPVWRRMKWPWGFVQEITKKADRVSQLLVTFNPDDLSKVKWEEVEEELIDIANYCRMFAAVTRMMREDQK